jgi:hypothetical protein
MPIERQTHPYEITIRFNFGAEHQCRGALGDFCGAHYIEGTAVVDTDTGEVLTYAPGQAQDLPREKVQEYLGTKFGQVEAGYRAMIVERDRAIGDLATFTAAAKQQNELLAAERDALKAECDALLERARSAVQVPGI